MATLKPMISTLTQSSPSGLLVNPLSMPVKGVDGVGPTGRALGHYSPLTSIFMLWWQKDGFSVDHYARFSYLPFSLHSDTNLLWCTPKPKNTHFNSNFAHKVINKYLFYALIDFLSFRRPLYLTFRVFPDMTSPVKNLDNFCKETPIEMKLILLER